MLRNNENELAAACSAPRSGQVTLPPRALGLVGTVAAPWAGEKRALQGCTQGSTAPACALRSSFPTPLNANTSLRLPHFFLGHLHPWRRGFLLAAVLVSLRLNPVFWLGGAARQFILCISCPPLHQEGEFHPTRDVFLSSLHLTDLSNVQLANLGLLCAEDITSTSFQVYHSAGFCCALSSTWLILLHNNGISVL